MENVMLDNAALDIETQFAKYQELSATKKVLKERIARAEIEKPSVKDRIFQRVLQGYQNELQNLDRNLLPLEKKINEARSDLSRKIDDIDIQTADLQDKLDEIVFRHRVGEFGDSELEEKQGPIETEYEELTQCGMDYVQTLEKLEMVQFETTSDTADTSTDHAVTLEPGIASKEDSAAPGEILPAAAPVTTDSTVTEDVAPADYFTPGPADTSTEAEEELELEPGDKENSLEDPSKWVGEFASEEFLRAPATLPDGNGTGKKQKAEDENAENDSPDMLGFSELGLNENKEETDPLSELADPSDDSDQVEESDEDPAYEQPEVQPSAATHETPRDGAGGGFPVLSITKGTSSGKKLPLLPMTMTLGRELDNNIELKDQDVARYHARITFHAGDYVIHDLEGSSGTFVNGEKISKVTLSPGDTIRAGDTELEFNLE